MSTNKSKKKAQIDTDNAGSPTRTTGKKVTKGEDSPTATYNGTDENKSQGNTFTQKPFLNSDLLNKEEMESKQNVS